MTAAPDPLQGYSISDAASLLDVSEESVRRLLVRGDLHGRLVGNRWRIARYELERWWRQGEKPAAGVTRLRRMGA